MYDPGRQSSGGNKMHPGAQLSRRERAAMERMLALEHGGAPPIAMPPPELLPRRPPSFVDPTPREPPAVVPTVPRRDTASNPGHALRSVALPRHQRDDDDDDDELNDAVALALRGADAEAELRWLRTERDALRAQVAHWRDASERHERALAERDTHTRQRLRKLGLWRLMGRLGLDARTNPQSRRALAQWLHACRERLRRAGRGGLEVSAPSPARARGFHRRVTGASPGLRGRPPEDDADAPGPTTTTLAGDDFPDSDSDDGEPGPHRWRDPGPEHTKRRIEARYNGRRNGPSADANSLWSESDSELNDDDANGGGGSRGGDDSESVLSYSTLASTVRTGANPFDDDDDDDDAETVQKMLQKLSKTIRNRFKTN